MLPRRRGWTKWERTKGIANCELEPLKDPWHGRLARESHGHLGRVSGSYATGETPVGLMGETPMLLF